ncbi:MAG: caspase family protein [Anaeromyxobacter sp.]
MIPSRSLRLALAALATAAGLSAGPAAGQAAPLAIRRLALVTGANDGGPERARLRYAISDAERFARVLQQMGGVAGPDLILLLDPDAAGLRAAMADLKRRVGRSAAEARTEVILYYSGHSDEDGLLLRGDRIPYRELRAWLEGTGAGVRIGILDSCASGNFTRGKGGIRTTPFLVDASTQVSGQVILTSSSADEASQESDRIGASFFTHYLVTGLRGAADASRDGKVTLSEVYQFAFHETLARTERTRSGPQHPAWDIALVGAGDVVMTDLRGTGATLVLPAPVVGRFFVRDAGERLVAELRKEAGEPVLAGARSRQLPRDARDRRAPGRGAALAGERRHRAAAPGVRAGAARADGHAR